MYDMLNYGKYTPYKHNIQMGVVCIFILVFCILECLYLYICIHVFVWVCSLIIVCLYDYMNVCLYVCIRVYSYICMFV